MSSSDHSFGSNNPFRRKPGAPVHPAATSSFTTSSSASFGIDRTPAPSVATTSPPFTTFKSAVQEEHQRNEEEQPVQHKPKKIAKKVRVQSPPPSSPEDAVPVTRFPSIEQLNHDEDDSLSDSSKGHDQIDPFNTEYVYTDGGQPTTEPPFARIPPNPFARTLRDIEGKDQVHNSVSVAPNTPKGSIDVDAFRRLVLTGQKDQPGPAQTVPDSAENGSGTTYHVGVPMPVLPRASNTDTSSIPRQSISDVLDEPPRTSHELSHPGESGGRQGVIPPSPFATVPSTSARKKPPPPSSRHGKLIKIDLGAGSSSLGTSSKSLDASLPLVGSSRKTSGESTSLQSPQATDVNKPLPAPPLRASADEDIDSPFDREAAGKVPEAFADLQSNPRPPTPPFTRSRSESQTSTQSRKPAAPPPRRHGRSDSRVPSIHSINADEEPPRSSMESSRSRTDNLRIYGNYEKASHTHAPPPPPPRRPAHTRQGSSLTSPSQMAFSSAASHGLGETSFVSGFTPIMPPSTHARNANGLGITTLGPGGPSKLSPPPPPPTRKQSIRRPPSVRSMESSNGPVPARRASREKEGGTAPPPPPPPRSRGSSRQNADLSVFGGEGTQIEDVEATSAGDSSATSVSGIQGVDILADLDALQREVDALMKKGAR